MTPKAFNQQFRELTEFTDLSDANGCALWFVCGQKFANDIRQMLQLMGDYQEQYVTQVEEHSPWQGRLLRLMSGRSVGSLLSKYVSRHLPMLKIHRLSEGARVPVWRLVLANVVYDLLQLQEAGHVACTSGSLLTKKSAVMVRCLDWELPPLGPYTQVFRHIGPHHPHKLPTYTVGVPGMVGATTVFRTGALAVAMNQAPAKGCNIPIVYGVPACSTVAKTVENESNYLQSLLKNTSLTPFFAHVLCTHKHYVVNNHADDADIRRADGEILVQANHHVQRGRRQFNPNHRTTDSWDRYRAMEEFMSKHRRHSTATVIKDLSRCAAIVPATQQVVVMDVLNGGLRAWARSAE